MAIAYRSHRTALVAGTSAAVIDKPAGTTEGDLLVAVASVLSATAPTPPFGWTLAVDHSESGYWASLYVFTKVAGASEPSSYSFNTGATSSAWVMIAYSGAAGVDTYVTATDADTDSSWSFPSATPTYKGDLGIVAAAGLGGTSWTPPSGTAERIGANAGLAFLGVADFALGGSLDPTGVKTATHNSVQSKIATILLRPTNQAPDAPTLISPIGGAAVDYTDTVRFEWVPSDRDPGDTSAGFDLQYRPTDSATWTTVHRDTADNHWDAPALTFAEGTYEWRVRTYDTSMEAGDWSAVEFFVAAARPPAPSILAPSPAEVISTETFLVEWAAFAQDAVEVRRVADASGSPDTGTVYWTSGTIPDPLIRYRLVTFDVTGRDEHVQVRVRVGAQWSDWASVRVTVDYATPPVPTAVVTPNDDEGAISVAVVNPAGDPEVVRNDIYRRLAGDTGAGIRVARDLAPGSSFTDRTVASGRAYEYRVRAVSTLETSAWSPWTP